MRTDVSLSPAKERILEDAFYPLHFLTAAQVTRLLYSPGSLNGVKSHLRHLAAGGYLERFYLPTGFAFEPYIYMYGNKGRQYIKEVRGWEVTKLPKLSAIQRRSYSWLAHLLEVNNVIIAAKLIEKYQPGVFLKSFEHDAQLKRKPFVATNVSGQKAEAIPDALLEIISGTKRRMLWVEVERGTNSNADLLAKLTAIYDLVDRRVVQERVGTNSVRVCYFTTAGQEDVERLRTLARRILKERVGEPIPEKRNLLFNFCAIPPMGEEIDVAATFLTPAFLHPFGEEPETVIDLPLE